MTTVNIVDRSTLLEGMYSRTGAHPSQTAIVTIDMHRGHLDMTWPPCRPGRRTRSGSLPTRAAALDFRAQPGIPVIHVILVYRRIPGLGSEGMVSPSGRRCTQRWARRTGSRPGARARCASTTSRVAGHRNHPELRPPGRLRHRQQEAAGLASTGTDLRFLLDTLGGEERGPHGHQHQYLRAEHLVHGVQFRTTAWWSCRTAWAACTATTCTCWTSEHIPLPGLGDQQRPVLRKIGAWPGAKARHRRRDVDKVGSSRYN